MRTLPSPTLQLTTTSWERYFSAANAEAQDERGHGKTVMQAGTLHLEAEEHLEPPGPGKPRGSPRKMPEEGWPLLLEL